MTPALTLFISVAGMVYSVTIAVYSVSDAEIKSMDSVYRQAFDDFFVLLNAGISILAWLLFLSTAGTTTPGVATLFILADAVFVIKELINLALFCWYDIPSIARDAGLDTQRHQVGLAVEIEAHEKSVWMNLVCAIGLTGTIAAWCLSPENLVVGALSLIAIGIIYWKKQDGLVRIKADMAAALQAIVDETTPWWMNGNESTANVDLMASNEGAPERERWDDWPHRDAPITGRFSQAGLFSRREVYNRTRNDGCVSDNQRSHQSVMVG